MSGVLAGRLNRRVRFETKTETQDAMGARTVSWVALCTVWGAVEPLRGREYLEAYKVATPVTTRITVRAGRDISAETLRPELHRAVDALRGTVYNIESVIESSLRREVIELMCTSGSNDGR